MKDSQVIVTTSLPSLNPLCLRTSACSARGILASEENQLALFHQETGYRSKRKRLKKRERERMCYTYRTGLHTEISLLLQLPPGTCRSLQVFCFCVLLQPNQMPQILFPWSQYYSESKRLFQWNSDTYPHKSVHYDDDLSQANDPPNTPKDQEEVRDFLRDHICNACIRHLLNARLICLPCKLPAMGKATFFFAFLLGSLNSESSEPSSTGHREVN